MFADGENVQPNETKQSGIMAGLRSILETKRWEYFITALIVINAIILGLQTSPSFTAKAGVLLENLDLVILGIFVVELALRMLAYGGGFWRDPWSLFDFSVVSIALIPATGSFSILRAFRILRALRLISTIKSMRVVVAGLLRALPGMGSIIVLLVLICYVFAVMATTLFGPKHPDLFGTVGASSYTLFQVMTLDGWSSEVVRPVMNDFPWAWAFFFVFILMTAFTVLNLFIGIIVEGIQSQHADQHKEVQVQTSADLDVILSEVRSLRAEVHELRTNNPGQNPQS